MAIDKELEDVMRSVLQQEKDALLVLSKEELTKQRWFYQHDPGFPAALQLYEFTKCLEMYKRACRQWEEFHNGSMSVVERVRDEYLMPRIKEFLELQASR
jgi:hypothetical protein